MTAGIEVNVTTEVSDIPVGAINGKFTINANGDQVYFSQGNLQYIGSASTPYWKFADHQWDYFGTSTGQNSDDPNVDRDLFGWGTSGWDNGNLYYQPYCTSAIDYNDDYEEAEEMGFGYGPTDGTYYNYALTGQYANADWGVYNPISNGGNTAGLWRTLTMEEWGYILVHRSTPSGIRFVLGNVNGVNGLILLPDSWNTEVCVLNNPNINEYWEGEPFSSNIFTLDEWEALENNGTVFLPMAGNRFGISVTGVELCSYYWLSSMTTGAGLADALYMDFYSGVFCGEVNYRCSGCSVRLVQDFEP